MALALTETLASGRALVRRARASDNAARCELFAQVAMETDLVLSVRRDPDFDALYRLQTGDWLSVVVELEGVVEGTGTILVRDGYIGGERRRVGYLGDLRFSPRLQGRLLLERFYGQLLAEVREVFGCELFLTAVIASNARALRALTLDTPRSRRAGRPRYAPMGGGNFAIRSLLLLLPTRAERSAYRVRRATQEDIPRVARMLDDDARSRPFGFVHDEAALRRRLREWPGFTIDSFYLADDRAGELVGCLALWDAAPVKRLIVSAYRGSMRRVRLAHDVVATLLGMPRLPSPGEALRYMYVTHQAVPSEDPDVLRALLVAAYRDLRGRGYHCLTTCAPADSALEPAFRGFTATNLPARLFVVSLPDVDVSSVTTGGQWPGFEMALV